MDITNVNESVGESESEEEEGKEVDYDSGNEIQVIQSDEFREDEAIENDVVKKINTLCEVESGEKVDKMLQVIRRVTDSITVGKFQDITSMFSDGAIFIVDGDSLIISAMADGNYDSNNGGQLLHLIYLCERLLQLFARRGGTFEVVFFNIWRRALSDNHILLLARTALLLHLKFNLNCKVHELESIWSEDFSEVFHRHKCTFLLIDFNMPEKLQHVFLREEHALYELLFNVQMCYSLLGLYLGCVDMDEVQLNASTLDAFYCSPAARVESQKLKKILHNMIFVLEQNIDILTVSKQKHNLKRDYKCNTNDVRNYVTVVAAANYLNDNNKHKDWISAFLIYSALLDVMPLKFRGCIKTKINPSDEFIKFMGELQMYIYNVMQTMKLDDNFNFKNVADLWHGNLLVTIVQFLTKFETSVDIMLGNQTLPVYEELLKAVNNLVLVPLEHFSLIEYQVIFQEHSKEDEEEFLELFPTSWPSQLLPTSCKITHEFCKEILPELMQNKLDETLKKFLTKNKNFEENKHWHSLKLLTDDFDRIKDGGKTKAANEKDRKHMEWMANKYAYYMSMYGCSVEGRQHSTKTIVCRNIESSKKKESKVTKVSKNPYKSKKQETGRISKSAQKIREDKLKKEIIENEKSDKLLLKDFDEKYKQYMLKGIYERAFTELERVEKKLKTDNSKLEMYLYGTKILWQLWKQECSVKELCKRNLKYAKTLFLLIRRILKIHENIPLKDKDSKQIAEYLHQMGLGRIAHEWKLPEVVKKDPRLSVGKNWIEFQLVDLGPELEREVGKELDSRVEGFIPDDWQRDLFDCVDRKQCALIVAPTSSGKTYASYYCMEEVLKDGNDGIVVYVAPTKALVNQVAATIYARFKNKSIPPGRSVYGIFTRDFRVNALTCQILVTVPQCLEMLLLSPRRHAWAKRLCYVIFDEIHCLASQLGAFTWESGLSLIQCPFIALSATIEDPEALHRWLQKIQNFKKSQDIINGEIKPDESYKVNLVIYRDRHADLKKYVYCKDEKFHHIHPYAYLDHMQIRKEGGIPTSISLSPEEVHQLYKAMKSSYPDNSELLELEPEAFFTSRVKGFLTRKSVRDYETELKKILECWVLNDYEMLNLIISKLNVVMQPLGELSEKRFITEHFEAFIDTLITENKLPVIVFSYNRGLVEYLFEYATEYFEDKLYEIESVNKKKVALKSEKEQKEPLGERGYRPKKPPLNILNTEGYNGVKEVGHADEKVVKYIERQLRKNGYTHSHTFSRGLRMGVGMHHSGLNTKARSAVEMLFRMRVLNIVFATGTLALGVHMPCKSVVVIGDSPFLNPLEFQQMSGRAGRRGFDTEGNVAFLALGEQKMKRLLLGKLPKMIGNIPLNITMVLRILLLVNTVTSHGEQTEAVTRNTLSRALTLLECCLVYENIPELRAQMKHFFAFATQLLILQGLLDDEGKPQTLTGIVTHLHYHEPGNLAFVFLLKSGALRRLCQPTNGIISKDTQHNLVIVLSYLFAPLKLHNKATAVEYDNSKVILPKLPSYIQQELEEYNKQVKYIFDNYFRCVAEHCSQNLGEDNSLPLSGIQFVPQKPFIPYTEGPITAERYLVETCEPRTVCSSFAALSGNTDRNLYSHVSTSNIRHQVFTDMKIVPVIEFDDLYNGYAWDFYNHGIAAAIRNDNGLRQGDDYIKLRDFLLILKCIETSLLELGPKDEEDHVLKTVTTVLRNFDEKFQKAYMNN